MSRRSLAIACAALAVLASPTFAGGHDGLPPAVKGRQAHMQLYAHNLGIMSGMARGNTEYNAEAATTAAENLAALTKLSQASYWVEGTSSDDVMESKALPAIFENTDEALAINADLSAAADELVAVAGDGAEALGGGLRAVGQQCGACHKKFQMDDD